MNTVAVMHPLTVSVIGGFIAALMYHIYILYRKQDEPRRETYYSFIFVTTIIVAFVNV